MNVIDLITYKVFKALLFILTSFFIFFLRSLYFIVFAGVGLFALAKIGVPATASLLIVASSIALLFILDHILKLDFFSQDNGLVKTRSLLTSFYSFSVRSMDDQITKKFQSLDRSHEVLKKFEEELDQLGVFDLSSDQKAKEVERILVKILKELGDRK